MDVTADKEQLLEERESLAVPRYRGEEIHYSWSCLWAEIK